MSSDLVWSVQSLRIPQCITVRLTQMVTLSVQVHVHASEHQLNEHHVIQAGKKQQRVSTNVTRT